MLIYSKESKANVASLTLFQRLLSSALLALVLSACTLGAPEKNSEEDSVGTFQLTKIEAKLLMTETHEEFSIPRAHKVGFRVCATEARRSRSEIRNATVVIRNPAARDTSEIATTTTDVQGCALWEESLSYNHLATPQFFTLERDVQLKSGGHQGTRKARFLFQPWSKQLIALTDANTKDRLTPAESEALLKSQASVSGNLFVQDMRLAVEARGLQTSGHKLGIEMRIDPVLYLPNQSGERTQQALAKGKFQIELFLVAALTSGEKRLLVKSGTLGPFPVNNGQILSETEIVLPNVCTAGQYHLGVRLTPVSAPEGLSSFEGLFTLGPCDSFPGNFFARQRALSRAENQGPDGFRLESYLPREEMQQLPTQSQVASAEDFVVRSGVFVDRLAFRDFETTGEVLSTRSRRFNTLTCLRSNLGSQAPLVGLAVTVHPIKGGAPEIRRTTVGGCIEWTDEVRFNVFERECWLQKSVRLVAPAVGLDMRIPILANAMANQGDSIVQADRGIDPVRFANLCNETNSSQDRAGRRLPEDQRSAIHIDQVNWTHKGTRYSINSALDLQIIRSGTLSFGARLVRASLSNLDTRTYSNLPVGRYKLRMAYVRMVGRLQTESAAVTQGITRTDPTLALEPRDILDVREQIVELGGDGSISHDIDLGSVDPDIRPLGNFERLFVDLLPLDEAARRPLLHRVFLTTLRQADSHSGGGAEILYQGETDIFQRLMSMHQTNLRDAQKRAEEVAQPSHFAQTANLRLLQVKDPRTWGDSLAARSSAGNAAHLSNWLRSLTLPEGFRQSLCRAFFDEFIGPNLQRNIRTRAIEECVSEVTKAPHRYFDIEHRFFVRNPSILKGADFDRNRPQGHTRDLAVTNAFAMGHSLNESTSNMWGWDVGSQAGTGLGDWLKKLAPTRVVPFNISASAGLKFSPFQITKAEQRAFGNQTAVQQGNYLTLEVIPLVQQAQSFQRCVSIRLDRANVLAPLIDPKVEPYYLLTTAKRSTVLREALTSPEADKVTLKILNSGWLICSGDWETPPSGQSMQFHETYYVISQRQAEAQAGTAQSDALRVFYLMLRGREDFARFMSALVSSDVFPPSYGETLVQTRLTDYDPVKAIFLRGIGGAPGQWVISR